MDYCNGNDMLDKMALMVLSLVERIEDYTSLMPSKAKIKVGNFNIWHVQHSHANKKWSWIIGRITLDGKRKEKCKADRVYQPWKTQNALLKEKFHSTPN